ncbi:protein bric-a-brac 2 [Dendroctonus ponderosae]|uniref:protein bric-a-brac 2 n=1 Tax=Dendroctonus ponderosae TaxID=77166 RepID=UPI00203641E4|nr:protein bric-a-brac 2 [Dendroctonus ponderosae]XP_048516621.1 protein bric-a-brac 2 [Dendroctonus ponderosae]XP_048516622.1 protein bric-a-brac 2 [Dendroctonus ponderosae]KAH1027854.1 hypothetical protein HUJ05_001285 [Dendroctonus ponderosae]
MENPTIGEQYNLKWNLHVPNFIHTFNEHFDNEALVDVSLFCEGRLIRAHKLILSACSEYFQKLFQVHKEVPHPVIFLNTGRFTVLRQIVHFMYHGEVRVADKDLPDVLALGESLRVKGLSSVKLRDMPVEEAKASNSLLKARKIADKPVQNTNIKRQDVPNKSILSDEPKFVPMAPAVTYSRRKSPKLTKPVETLPVISSVVSLASPIPIVAGGSSLVKRDIANNETPKSSTINEEANISVSKPPHAFMIFAKEWRKKLTVEHPEENNKEISVRLGVMWKSLLPETKNIYYREAKRAEDEHKSKYPNYDSASGKLKRKADVLSDSTNNTDVGSLDRRKITDNQEEINISDSD